MGGKIKPAATMPAATIYRPFAGGWQKWLRDEAGAWTPSGEALELVELKPAAGGLIAVPVRRAFSLSLWVPADDPGLFRDLVFTQLELRGLAGRTVDETTYAWREITREGNEALLQVVVLPAHLAPRYWHGDVIDYAVSPACLPLVADSVSIWREEGNWVAAVTRGTTLLHFQPLCEDEPGSGMALEVWLMLAPLEAGRMTAGVSSAVFYTQPGEELDLGAWQAAGGLPAQVQPWPAPVWPDKALGCIPLPVRALQQTKAIGARRQRLAFAGAAVYLAIVLALAGQTLWLHWRARGLQAELDRDAPTVAATKDATERWNSLQAALDPLGYPLEVLYQAARLLPKDGVRLILFEMNLGRVVIQGEASTFPAAQKFQDEVKKNTELQVYYDWTADNPKSLQNGSARFQIDGARRGAEGEKTDKDNETPNS
jgi:hypothetical protein